MQNRTIQWLLTVGLILLCKLTLSAQYFPSPQDNPRWVMNIWSLGQFLDKEEIWTEQTTVLLEGESWTPLIRVHHWNPNSPLAPPNPTPDTMLLGYYRTEAEQVYYRDNSTEGSSYVRTGQIYDFSLEAGDSIYLLGPANTFPYREDTVLYKIQETGTFECDGETRKWLHVNFHQEPSGPSGLYHDTYWVQGIGDIQHPFIPSNCLSWSGNCESVYLDQTLFLDGDSTRITGQPFPCVPLLTTSVWELEKENQQLTLKLFPNPVSSSSTVYIQPIREADLDMSYVINLYAPNGQLIHRSTNDLRQPLRLPQNMQTTGLYQVVVRNKHGAIYGSASLLVVD